MEWEQLFDYQLTTNWQYSIPVRGRNFKVQFIYADVNRNSIILLALANVPSPNTTVESTEFFKPQQIKPLVESEIIRFAEPPKNWRYRIAVKKIPIPRQPISETRIRFFMPVIDLTPDQPVVNPTIATTKNVVTVPIAGNLTTSVKLLPESATKNRKHATFYNPSTKRNLYIDTDSTINTASAVAKIAPGKIYVSDFPNWQGEYWGMMDGTDTAATAVAIEEYV